jgi:hypothetical protein
MAQTPTINMAKVDGTGAGTRAGATDDNDAAWTAPATRLAQTGINNNLMAASVPDGRAIENQPQFQN